MPDETIPPAPGAAAPEPTPTPAAPSPAPSAPSAPPANVAPPPVAHAAVTGPKSERELELERRLKQREIEIAERDDRARQLSERLAALERPPAPAPAAPKTPKRFGFFVEEE